MVAAKEQPAPAERQLECGQQVDSSDVPTSKQALCKSKASTHSQVGLHAGTQQLKDCQSRRGRRPRDQQGSPCDMVGLPGGSSTAFTPTLLHTVSTQQALKNGQPMSMTLTTLHVAAAYKVYGVSGHVSSVEGCTCGCLYVIQ